MHNSAAPPESEPTAIIRDLYPGLTDEELKEAEANLRAYFEVALDICASIDSAGRCSTMEERSKANLKN